MRKIVFLLAIAALAAAACAQLSSVGCFLVPSSCVSPTATATPTPAPPAP